ncbi:MAG: hypothetical protein ABI697_09190 [Devosia sp.]
MMMLRSWGALLRREYLEHRVAFLYFPLGVMGILLLAALSGLGINRVKVVVGMTLPAGLKLFELGYIALVGLWFSYLALALFFYFGDAFSADRRNNAMLFWKSMPVSDLRILAGKFLAGIVLFPVIIALVAAITGVMHYALVSAATMLMPGLIVPVFPLEALASFAQITLLMLVHLGLGLLWYAPFFAWVAGLSAVFGRWSLPLAFAIPGLIAVVENVALFGTGPRGGYVWSYISQRFQFGLTDVDYTRMFTAGSPFEAGPYILSLWHAFDGVSVVTGLLFAAAIIWLASEYRRRRLA